MSRMTTGLAAAGADDVRHARSPRPAAVRDGIPRTDWRVWRAWVGATMVGAVLAAVLTSAVSAGRAGFALTLLAGVGGALTVGATQGLVLRRYCPALSMPGWLAATIGGHVAAAIAALVILIPGLLRALRVVGSFAGPAGVAFVTTAAIGAVAGAVSGCAAWLVLRRHFPRAGVWILAAAVAGAIAALAPIPRIGGTIIGIPLAPIVARVGTALFTASITGIALAWLVRRRAADASNASGLARATHGWSSAVPDSPNAP